MVTVTLLDFIGENTDEFFASLPKDNEDVTVEINSPGGDASAGLAILNKLNDLGGEITIDIMGMAASAASLIAMAGDKILIRDNARMMIHNPFTFTGGDSKQLKKSAEELEKLELQVANIYANRTGLELKTILKMMSETTWLDAKQAVKKGFATELVKSETPKPKNFYNKMVQIGYANVPDEYRENYIEFHAKQVEAQMLTEIRKQLGIPEDGDVEKAIKKMQENLESLTGSIPNPDDNKAVLLLTGQVKDLELALATMAQNNAENTGFRKETKRTNAQSQVDKLVQDCYLLPAQVDGAMAIYDVSETAGKSEIFNSYLENVKAGGVNQTALSLQNKTGSGGDGRQIQGDGDPEALYMARLDIVASERKIDDVAADVWIRENEPQLAEAYDRAVTPVGVANK